MCKTIQIDFILNDRHLFLDEDFTPHLGSLGDARTLNERQFYTHLLVIDIR